MNKCQSLNKFKHKNIFGKKYPKVKLNNKNFAAF